MKDWQGNEIKEGDEICLIKVVNKQFAQLIGYFMPDAGFVTDDIIPPGNEACWEVGEYKEVFNYIGYLCVRQDDRYKNGEPLVIYHSLESVLLFTDMSNMILAIKGVSDKQELYNH